MRLSEPDPGPAPSRLTWPAKRFFWFLEKHLLWPISDAFRRNKSPRPRREADSGGGRSPLAWIGLTFLVALTGGAIAAAVYFHNQANESAGTPAVAQAPGGSEAGIVPGEATVPSTGNQAAPGDPAANADETLQGVAPDFEASAGQSDAGSPPNPNGSGGGSKNGDGSKGGKKAKGLVAPAPMPESPPLKTAWRFARTFTGYEIGEKGAAKDFTATATPELAGELRRNPPTLPADGDVPRATVMNVVKGQEEGRRLLVSVSLLRSGATSELRLALKQSGKKKPGKAGTPNGTYATWRVSEVRG